MKKINGNGGLATLVAGSFMLAGCGADIVSVRGTGSDYRPYSNPSSEIRYNLIFERQTDGNDVCEIPRIPDLQTRLKKTIIETVSVEKLKFRKDGTLTDIRYIIKFPDGSVQFVPYQNE